MVLVQKWPFLQLFLFRHYRPGKCLFRYSRTNKRICRLKKQGVQKVKTFFQKGLTSAFGPKMAIFSKLFSLANIRLENVFYDILEQKNASLGYKNNNSKKSKNWHFSKGVNSWFLSKNGHFSNFGFLGNIGQANVFYDILERKNAFLGYKNNKFKKSKNWRFSKGVNPWFWSKTGHFPDFSS